MCFVFEWFDVCCLLRLIHLYSIHSIQVTMLAGPEKNNSHKKAKTSFVLVKAVFEKADEEDKVTPKVPVTEEEKKKEPAAEQAEKLKICPKVAAASIFGDKTLEPLSDEE